MEINVVPQVVELVEERVVVEDLEEDVSVVLDVYHQKEFVDQTKMHLAPSTKVNAKKCTFTNTIISFSEL